MIGIISDVHGNHAALRAVLERLDAMGVDDIICLGDVAGYYCQVNECCETLRERGIFTLLGNHDHYLANGDDCPRSNSANRCIEYQRTVVTAANLAWLSGLRSSAERHGISIVHGGWRDPLDEYLVPTSDYFSGLPGRYFASGHTHVPCTFSGAGKSYCNPGSVGQPRDGNPDASFATWDGSAFSLHRTPYDIAEIQERMAAAGFDRYFYENLEAGTQIGGRISTIALRQD
jgi:predicted phosphodiesterase